MKTIQSYLPVFNGFYCTHFEPYQEESEIDYYNEENETNLTYDDFVFDYSDYKERVANACVSEIQNQLRHDFPSITVDFETIVSPRFYNYTNDTINVTYSMDENDFNLIVDYLKNNLVEFEKYLTENYTSRSGFSSFWESEPEIWFTIYLKENLQHCFGSILEFYFQNEGFNDFELSQSIASEMYIASEVATS